VDDPETATYELRVCRSIIELAPALTHHLRP
jgi:hypothetical protein